MSIIESLILNTGETNSKNISSNKNTENFLMEIIDLFKKNPEKLIDFFKNLNITEKDLEKAIPKDKAQELESLMEKLKNALTIQEEAENNKPISLGEITDDDFSDIQSDIINQINEKISNAELETKLEKFFKNIEQPIDTEKKVYLPVLPIEYNTPQITIMTNSGIITRNYIPEHKTETGLADIPEIETKAVEVIKRIINSQKNLNALKLKEQDIQQLKNASTLKDLIDFADKKKLNISKIILSSKKNTDNQNQKKSIPLPKNKITLPVETQKIKTRQPDKTPLKTKPGIINSLITNKSKEDSSISSKKDSFLPELQPEKKISEQTLKSDVSKDGQKENSQKNQNADTKTALNTNGNTAVNLKQNILKAKESVKHFANNLKEAVENYKPPVSKLSMELHPKELGKVEVTIVHRGDNLQIQINSNNTAINFLHSQQQELRQNLINMGFTDVNMSFSQQQQQQNSRGYKQNHKFSGANEENEELIIEFPYQYA